MKKTPQEKQSAKSTGGLKMPGGNVKTGSKSGHSPQGRVAPIPPQRPQAPTPPPAPPAAPAAPAAPAPAPTVLSVTATTSSPAASAPQPPRTRRTAAKPAKAKRAKVKRAVRTIQVPLATNVKVEVGYNLKFQAPNAINECMIRMFEIKDTPGQQSQDVLLFEQKLSRPNSSVAVQGNSTLNEWHFLLTTIRNNAALNPLTAYKVSVALVKNGVTGQYTAADMTSVNPAPAVPKARSGFLNKWNRIPKVARIIGFCVLMAVFIGLLLWKNGKLGGIASYWNNHQLASIATNPPDITTKPLTTPLVPLPLQHQIAQALAAPPLATADDRLPETNEMQVSTAPGPAGSIGGSSIKDVKIGDNSSNNRVEINNTINNYPNRIEKSETAPESQTSAEWYDKAPDQDAVFQIPPPQDPEIGGDVQEFSLPFPAGKVCEYLVPPVQGWEIHPYAPDVSSQDVGCAFNINPIHVHKKWVDYRDPAVGRAQFTSGYKFRRSSGGHANLRIRYTRRH